jgi:hypothetical protein
MAAAAQETATLNGYVTDASNQETLIGAVIRIKGLKLGGVTNTSGFFSVGKIPPGKHTVIVSMIGYEKQEVAVDLAAGESRKITVTLKPAAANANNVIVRGERNDENRQIAISRVNIPVEQLNQIRIGGEADVFRSLQYLPGVLTSSQISSGLFIRGGSPDQNLVLLDGSTVYNPSHLFGFFSTFNPDAMKDVELIKGGYPAEYGGRLSAVLNITQKDGNRNEVEGVASLGVISSRLSLQGPVGNGSWFIGGRRTYLDLITKLIPEDPENPLPDFAFYDLNAKVTQDLGSNDRLSLSGFASNDDLELNGAGLSFDIGIGNRTGAARWTHIFDEGLFSIVNLSASRYSNGFKGDNGGYEFEVGNTISDYTAKAHLEWYASDDLSVKGGLEGTKYRFEYLQNFTGKTDKDESTGSQEGKTELTVYDWTFAGFLQGNYQLTDLLSMQAGVHLDYLDLSNTLTVDPRLALRYQAQEDIVLKASVGIFHQYLRLASIPDFSFFDTWLPTDSTVVPSDATHYILGLETEPFDGYDFNVDLYYKTLHNISELNELATRANTVAEIFFSGDGNAYGAELFLQKKKGDLTGWLGYALGFVNARFDSVNGGREFRPKYDRRHDMKIVGQYRLSDRWEVGASFTFQTGQSYTAATSRFRSRFPGESIGTDLTVPADRYGLRLPPSHQLNINVNYNTTVFDLPARLLIDIFNVYSRRDIWFRYYDTSGDVTTVTDVKLLPIIPTVSFEMKF